MFWLCFIIIAVINMKSSIAMKQNEFDNVSEHDLVADEVKGKVNKTKIQEMGISLYQINQLWILILHDLLDINILRRIYLVVGCTVLGQAGEGFDTFCGLKH